MARSPCQRGNMTKKLFTVLIAMLCIAAYAQEYRATITGTITDPSGATIPNASIKATNTATNSVSETKSTSEGVYTLPFLEPGVYKVEVTAPGFQTLNREAITLTVGQRLNFPLR